MAFPFGEYLYEKKKKRDELVGSVTIPGTPVTLQGQHYTTGPFILEEIWISNFGTETVTISILDGVTYKVRDANAVNGLALAAGAWIHIENIWMPFETSVSVDASSTDVIFTFGGWIP